MNQFNKPTRSPFLNAIRKAFALFLESKKPGSPPLDELIKQSEEEASAIHRRQFIGNIAKAGVFIGAAGLMEACRKVSDVMPVEALQPLGSMKNARQSSQPRIAIIGAGISGLNCAYQLKKAGIRATVYEASDSAGGRILSKTNLLGHGLYTECGGEFIDTDHKNMRDLAAEFGLTLVDTRVASEDAYVRDTFCINGQFYTEAMVMQAFAPYADKIASDIKSLPASFGFNNYNTAVLNFDQMSISGYFESIGMPSSSFLRIGLEQAYLTEYGREVNDQTSINFLYLFSIKPATDKYAVFGASDERFKVMGGNQQIPNAIYSNLKDQVVLGSRLVKISVGQNNVYTIYFDKGPSVKADIVVVTIPFTVLRSVDLSGLAFPSWKTNAIQNLGYGSNAKLLMGFNSRVWRNYLYSGYVFTNGSRQYPSTYVQTGWDNSWMEPGTIGGYTVFQGGNQGNALSLGQTGTFLSQLENMWPGALNAYNGVSKLFHWPSNPYSLASYSCWRVGQVTTIAGAEGLPIGNIYFAGEHTSLANQGYMEGGAETGSAVAKAIIKSV